MNALHQQDLTSDDSMAPIHLARFQTELSLERAMHAWIGTTLSIISFGFGLVAFFRSLRAQNPGSEARHIHQAAIGFGLCLLVIGLFALISAGASYHHNQRLLRQGQLPRAGQWPLTLIVTGLLALLGIAGLIAMTVLVA